MLNRSSKLRDRIREATADAILEAAEVLFAEQGLAGAKVDAIAAKAGVSVGTLYNHFQDRDGLLSALIETRRADVRAQMDELTDNMEGRPFREVLTDFFRVGIEHFDAHSNFYGILFQCELERQSLPGKEAPREAIREFYRRVKSLTDYGIRSGALRSELADLLPGILMGVWKARLLASVYEGKSGPMIERVDQFVGMFLDGAGLRHE